MFWCTMSKQLLTERDVQLYLNQFDVNEVVVIELTDCPDCEGSAFYYHTRLCAEDDQRSGYYPCTTCSGRGKIRYLDKVCTK